MYPEYEAFILGSVKRLEKSVLEQARAGRIVRIVDVSVAKAVTTSHGQGNIEIAEVIDVEAEESALLGEEDFTPLKFFSREGDSDCEDEVNYDHNIHFANTTHPEQLAALSKLKVKVLQLGGHQWRC